MTSKVLDQRSKTDRQKAVLKYKNSADHLTNKEMLLVHSFYQDLIDVTLDGGHYYEIVRMEAHQHIHRIQGYLNARGIETPPPK